LATELSSGTITSILEAVPGIATVLRSPVADAIVNLSRAAAGLQPFDKKDAHELIRYAVRRGLIRSDEGDRVAAEIDGIVLPKPSAPRPQVKPAAPVVKKHVAKKAAHRPPPRAKKAAPRAAHRPAKKK
jgi:hypothetical protein